MPLHVSVVSPERVVFEGDVESVRAPAFDGELGILPRHAPMVTMLGTGVIRLGSSHRFTVQGGVLQVVDNNVRVITEHATEA
jgi:F-type H+-transporting ATPase subunit epsilon